MDAKSEESVREFSHIHSGFRIVIPRRMREALGWRLGDQVLLEAYKGRLVVENLSSVRPIGERIEQREAPV